MSDVTEKQLEDIEALFVQTAASMTSDGEVLTLKGLSPSTLYFADRPQREVGHMSSRQFVANWGEGDNSFAANPPNAVLSFAEPGDRASRGCRRGDPRSTLGWRRSQLQHQAPRRNRAQSHRAMRTVHRPVGSSSVSGVRGGDAPPGASPGTLRVEQCSVVGGGRSCWRQWTLITRSEWPTSMVAAYSS